MTIEPKKSVGPIGRMVSLISDFPLLPATLIDRGSRPAPVPPGESQAYGEYLAKAGGCTSCHGASLSGGQPIDNVKAANITPGGAIGKWTEADFVTALRTGKRPDGTIISAAMPWPYMKGLTDTELKAMWMYLHTLPARQMGEK